MLKYVNRLFRYLFCHTKWRIGISHATIQKIFDRGIDSFSFKWLEFNNSAVHADPFVYNRKRNYYIFYEDLNLITNLKKIRWVCIDDNLDTIEDGDVIGLPFDASYPFLIEHDKSIYCIPEAHKEKNISLYVATLFPTHWEKVCTLINDVKGIDPTLYQHAEKWWLFYSDKDDNPNEKLFLSYSSKLFGPYNPHPGNPIVVDKSSARSAGNLINLEGNLFRLGQNCSRKYGSAVVVNEIVNLNKFVYREEKKMVLRPGKQWKYVDGLHTLSFCENLVAIDARSIHFSLATFLKRLISLPQTIKAK